MSDSNNMSEQRRKEEDKVLQHLRSVMGSTAWAMTGAVGLSREDVSNACQRLKRRGLVATSPTQATYWQAVKP